MKPTKIYLTFLVAIFLIAPANAFGGDDTRMGKRLYKSFCLVCHGPDGDTVGPLAGKLGMIPTDLNVPKYQEKSVEQLAFIIGGYGRPDARTMSFAWKDKLSDRSIRNIAAYIKVINSSNVSLKGDGESGKIIYANSCAACHGPEGKGSGLLAEMLGDPKVGYTKGLSIKYLDDDELVSVIREGKGDFMPAWEGILNNDEIFDAAAYVRSLGK